jgi:hypothetical protein
LRADDTKRAVMNHFTVSDVGRRFGVAPRVISDLFYARKLDDRRCPIIGGRRLIPAEYLSTVEAALRRSGQLASDAAVAGEVR